VSRIDGNGRKSSRGRSERDKRSEVNSCPRHASLVESQATWTRGFRFALVGGENSAGIRRPKGTGKLERQSTFEPRKIQNSEVRAAGTRWCLALHIRHLAGGRPSPGRLSESPVAGRILEEVAFNGHRRLSSEDGQPNPSRTQLPKLGHAFCHLDTVSEKHSGEVAECSECSLSSLPGFGI
jgi:hypothetical protein